MDDTYDDSGAVQSSEFDYDSLSNERMGFKPETTQPEEEDYSERFSIKKLIRYLRNGNNPRSKEIRIEVLWAFMESGQNQVLLAKDIGCTKQALSQAMNAFRDDFKITRPAGSASSMRDQQMREKHSTETKARHAAKKQQQTNTTQCQTTTCNLQQKPQTSSTTFVSLTPTLLATRVRLQAQSNARLLPPFGPAQCSADSKS